MTDRHVLHRLAALLVSVMAASPPAWAHHSVTGAYDTTKVIAVAGAVREFDLGSPHSSLIIDVLQRDGHSIQWHTELASASFLRRAGWTERSLTVGEQVRLTGCPGRLRAAELYVTSVTRANGTRLALIPSQ